MRISTAYVDRVVGGEPTLQEAILVHDATQVAIGTLRRAFGPAGPDGLWEYRTEYFVTQYPFAVIWANEAVTLAGVVQMLQQAMAGQTVPAAGTDAAVAVESPRSLYSTPWITPGLTYKEQPK